MKVNIQKVKDNILNVLHECIKGIPESKPDLSEPYGDLKYEFAINWVPENTYDFDDFVDYTFYRSFDDGVWTVGYPLGGIEKYDKESNYDDLLVCGETLDECHDELIKKLNNWKHHNKIVYWHEKKPYYGKVVH